MHHIKKTPGPEKNEQNGFLLTILILTHNRPERCNQLLKKLLALDAYIGHSLEILVIDDSSAEFAGAVEPSKSIRLIKHGFNVGFKRSFFEGLSEALGAYIVYLADDDGVNLRVITDLLSHCSSDSADFYSTRFSFRSGGGRCLGKNAKLISAREFFNVSFHAPGLVFKREAVRNILAHRNFVDVFECYFVDIFPQVVIVLLMFKMGMVCRWLDIEIAFEEDTCLSNLRDSDGRTYKDPISRLRQIESLCQVVDIIFNEQSKSAAQVKQYCLRKYDAEFRYNLREAFPRSKRLLISQFQCQLDTLRRFPVEFLKSSFYSRMKN